MNENLASKDDMLRLETATQSDFVEFGHKVKSMFQEHQTSLKKDWRA